ncbi:uncharacterized protein [Triticum aestivum]|uniref:uncharacterized protein isoform X1 n=1 Tax=Triticum aestivum TaxID=4565 RepID=UPI001D0072BE|nr:uncharacterized protein LOC123069328 isoform X1 [Triticum aestivum]
MALRGVWQLQKLVVNFCDWGGSSKGIRAFMESHLPAIKEKNPQLEVVTQLVRGQHPNLKGIYRVAGAGCSSILFFCCFVFVIGRFFINAHPRDSNLTDRTRPHVSKTRFMRHPCYFPWSRGCSCLYSECYS